MRIAHLTNAYAPHSGGVRTFAHALGRGYQDRGHELVLVVPADRARRTRQDWGVLVTLPAPRVPGTAGYRAMVDSRTVRATLDSLEVDAIEVSDRFTLRHTGAWARAAGVPSLVLLHERLDGVLRALHVPAAAARAMADRHNRRTLAAFDHVVVTTRFAGRELERLGVEPEVVPLGVDLVRFHPLAAARAGEVPDDTVPWRTPARLVLCSRLSPEKRPDLAVDALGVLLARGTDAELVIAGTGPARPALERRAKDLPVTFLGHLDDRAAVAALLAGADVVLAPGPVETFGLAALEALACGTPVVASSTSALAEIVTGDAGATAPPHPAALARAVEDVLAQPPAPLRRGARARAEQFTWRRTVDALLAVHDSPARRLQSEAALPMSRSKVSGGR